MKWAIASSSTRTAYCSQRRIDQVPPAGFSITIEDRATPFLRRMSTEVQANAMLVGARAVAICIREHLQGLQDDRPNKKGWPRQNFWNKSRRSVQNPVPITGGAEVSINMEGFAQRLYGGTIKPRTAKYLTIPMRAEAYGKRAREMNLSFAIIPGLGPCLIEAGDVGARKGRKGKKGAESQQGGLMFLLRRSVVQQPDPSVMPTVAKMHDAATEAIGDYVDRVIEREDRK